MKVFNWNDLAPALPEVFMATAVLVLLLVSVFRKNGNDFFATGAALIIMIITGVMLVTAQGAPAAGSLFSNLFIVDSFSVFAKVLTLIGAGVTLAMARGFMEREQCARFEFPVLILLASLGMLVMISSNNFMSLYMGLELQSLSLYVLAAWQRDNTRATEAGIKYYILGALASGLLLYGISLVYGFSGTVNFSILADTLKTPVDGMNIGIIVGMVFVVAGLAFKISAVPFHMWTPDVYEGAPTPITAFFSIAPKIAAIALLVRVMVGPFGGITGQWQQIIVFISILSMVLGALAAIPQNNIKRLMAYSSIGHVGYLLVGVATGTSIGIQGVLFYLSVYMFMNLGTFAIILSMRSQGRMVEGINDLAGLSKTHPMMAVALAVFMFSMAGIPPMAGFWGKFYVFKAAIDANMITLAVIGVLASVVSAFYYLRIIKIMYFDEAVDSFDRPIGLGMSSVMTVCAVAVLLITIIPGTLAGQAAVAAASLFK